MNFLIVAIDSLRADRVLPGRTKPPPTPKLDRLIERGTLFTQAITACNLTTPSFTSLLTGRFVPRHGVHSLHGCRLPRQCPSLVETLQQGGYHTFAEVTGPLVEFIGLNRGFTSYQYRDEHTPLASLWGEELVARLRRRDMPEPWFGLLHLWETHSPYYVPSAYNTPKYGNTRYDRSFAALDEPLARLIEALPPDTAVVLMGDHGENLTVDLDLRLPAQLRRPWHRRLGWLWQSVILQEFSAVYRQEDQRLKARLVRRAAGALACLRRTPSRNEYYRRWVPGHGETLYDEAMRVPLLLVGPGLPARTVGQQVRTVDVLPTLLELADLPLPAGGENLDGRSLLPLAAGKDDGPRPAHMQTGGGNLPDSCLWVHGIRTPEFKYVFTPTAPAHHALAELYDLRADPGERRNILAQAPAVAARLRAECEAVAAAPAPVHEPEDDLTEEEEAVLADRLRQLGYLE